MKDYKTTNLDPNLMPKDGLGTAVFESGYGFDARNERGAVSTMHLRSLTADMITSGTLSTGVGFAGTITGNQINGGTITLGGTANGDGRMVVNNAGGTEVVRLDNTGIVISQGSINNVTVSTTIIQSGTINNAVLGTPRITGGTASAFLVGTSTITGGTVNPGAYQFGGTVGATGTFTYLNAGTVPGTIVVMGGLITSIT